MSQVIFYARVALVLLVVCCCSTQAALAQIAPTNSATISGSVSDVVGKPVAHAKVSLSGPKSISTQTDAQGLFVFIGVPFGTYSISAAATGLGTATRSVSVQGDVNVAIQYEPASMNGLRVIANVSSVSNAHFNVTPASITQVNPIANAFEGKTSWRTILEQIPGVAQAGLGTGDEFTAAVPNGPFLPMQISINGTLPYETATLLDDMPLITSLFNVTKTGTGTNLGLYSLNSFDAADVVRGPGANAPSIVDSVGGSFVLHSPGIVEKNTYEFSSSTDTYGGIIANALEAVRWNKLSAVLTYGVNDSPGPLSNATPYYLSPSTVNGLPFSNYNPPCVSPTCQYGSYLFNTNYAFGSFPYYGLQEGLLVCCVDQNTAWSQHSGSLALNYHISPSLSAGFFYTGQRSEVGAGSNIGDGLTINFMPPAGYAGSLPAGTYLLSPNFIDPIQTGTFLNVSSLLEEKITAQLGRGILRLAALQNNSWESYSSVQGTSSKVFQLYGGGTWNGSPAVFNGESYTVALPLYLSTYTCWTNNRDLLLSYATPLGDNVHAGLSFVKSYYNSPSTTLVTMPYLFSGNESSSLSQTTNEFRVFVGGNPSMKTSLDLSAYFVNADYHVPDPTDPNSANYYLTGVNYRYADARFTYAAPRLGFVWRPTAAVAIRVSAGGGFAEPQLYDFVGSNGSCAASATSCSITLTNLNLQPEKSFAFDLGADIRLPQTQNVVFSFDVYRTNLFGQAYQSTTFAGNGTCPGNTTAPCFVNQWGNLGLSRFEGILLEVRHDVARGPYWVLSGGFTRGYLVSVPADFYNTAGGTCNPATGTNCTNLNVVPNVNFNGTFAASIPYAQGHGTFGYRWSPDKYVDLVGTYYGNNNTYFRPAFMVWDGHIGYPLTKNLSLLATFQNITGMYDGSVEYLSPSTMSGAPTISGLPNPLYGEEYGPRTLQLTLDFRH